MEKLGFLRDGVVKMPPGFRFFPTDEELVVQYLKRKVFSCPLPASIIPEIDVCKFDPWDLPGEDEQVRYFFSMREAKYPNGNRANRATGSGYWKATGTDKKIVASKSNQVVGMKKVLVFYSGKPPNGSRTNWIMHEYRLSDATGSRACIFPQRKNSNQNAMMQTGDWVVCRIFLKKRSNGDDGIPSQSRTTYRARNHGSSRINFIDFLGRETSASSDSSSITEISCNEENNSTCNSFSSSP